MRSPDPDPSLDPRSYHPGESQDGTFIAVLVGALVAIFVLLVVVIAALLIRRRKKQVKFNGSPLKLFIGHDHVNFHSADHATKFSSSNGNVYRVVASDDSDSYAKDDSLTKLTSTPVRCNGSTGATDSGGSSNGRDDVIQGRRLPQVPCADAGWSLLNL